MGAEQGDYCGGRRNSAAVTNEDSSLVLLGRQGHGQVSSAFSSLSFLPTVNAMVHPHRQLGWI